MKLNVKGLVFVGFAAAVFANAAAFAANETVNDPKTVTSTVFTERTYQKKLTPGNFVAIDENNNITTTYSAGNGIDISGTGVISVDESDLERYKAGTNVTFGEAGADGKIPINATDTTYSAGDNIQINNGVISATDTTYTAGTNVQINNGVISATDTTYTAGTGLTLSGTEFSVDESDLTRYKAGTNVTFGEADGEGKIPINATDTTYTAGTNVQINNGVISATDTNTTYSAGTGLELNGTTFNVTGNLTDYAAGTNVEFTAGTGANEGKTVISATDTNTTYAAGSHVTISGNNNAIGVTVDGTITENNTGIVDGGTVYAAINGKVLPAAQGCSPTAPCALVATGESAFAWQPIQQ